MKESEIAEHQLSISSIEKNLNTIKELLTMENIDYSNMNTNILLAKDKLIELETELVEESLFNDDANMIF